jgi:hypothetical protein
MERLNTHQKALTINLDRKIYGTFAEIGAGQEIVRWFFKVGGSAGTVAKSMSAYDMTFSDEIYGKAGRYVSRDRLRAMLDHEYTLLIERLAVARGKETTFFAFADTVSARNYKGTNECHGWMGIRFQSSPEAPPSEILLHVNMLDRENLQQQEALGILGVNLVYAAFRSQLQPQLIIRSLLDELSVERIEIDMIEFSGEAFADADNRRASLCLLHLGLAQAVVFDADHGLLQLSELAHKRPVMLERGSFRALNELGLHFAEDARTQFSHEASNLGKQPLYLVEISIHELQEIHDPGDDELLHQIEELWKRGYSVMVSRFREFYQVTNYLRRYTSESLTFLMGISTLVRLCQPRYYDKLAGKVLEGLSRFFTENVYVYAYPMRKEEFVSRLSEASVDLPLDDNFSGAWIQVSDLKATGSVQHLFNYLIDEGAIVPIKSGQIVD